MSRKLNIIKLSIVVMVITAMVLSFSLISCKTATVASTTAAAETTAAPVTTAAGETTVAAETTAAAEMPLDQLAVTKAKELAAGKDITLNVLVTWDAPGQALEKVKEEWTEATGIKVVTESLSTLEMEQKVQLELASGQPKYDIIQYDGYIRGPLLENPGVLNLDPFLAKYPINFDTMVPGLEKFGINSAGNHVAIPFYWTNFIMVYRKDLIDDPKEHEAFKAKYGYDYDINNLTWDKSYPDLAEFFTRDLNNDGNTELFGTAEMGAPYAAGDCFTAQYLNRWDNDKTFFLDPATGKATFDDQAARDTLDNIKNLVEKKYMVPEYLQTDWASILGTFASGKCALAFQYTPTWTPLQAATSDFKYSGPDKVGFTAIPGMEGKKRMSQDCVWDSFINKNSKNQELAYLFILWAGSEKIDKEMAMTTLHMPVRQATYKDPEVLKVNVAFQAEFLHSDGFLEIPSLITFSEAQKTITDHMAAVVTGKETSDEAVKKAAAEVEAQWAAVTKK